MLSSGRVVVEPHTQPDWISTTMSTAIDALDAQLRLVHEQLGKPIPTPHIGCIVVWYDRGIVKKESQRAAIVTAKEGPGQVSLEILSPKGLRIHKTGVKYINDPDIKDKLHNHARVHNGLWDYTDGYGSPRTHHFDLHREKLIAREERLREEKRVQINSKMQRDAQSGVIPDRQSHPFADPEMEDQPATATATKAPPKKKPKADTEQKTTPAQDE